MASSDRHSGIGFRYQSILVYPIDSAASLPYALGHVVDRVQR